VSARAAKIVCRPATSERWSDVERLFGERGACGGCWCMVWRLTRAEFERQKGEGNRRAFKRIVDAGAVPGVIAYAGREPIGWCAVAPRETYGALERSRVLAPVDAARVWSVSCLFVARPHRGRGVSVALLEGAVAHARARGARLVEGYPVEPRKGKMPDAFAWTGIPSAFARAGFREVARRSETRPIMRRAVRPA
jgi:GNAT superfamily N-acetyltransferase